MTLTTQPRRYRRMVFALCCYAADTPMTEAQKQAVEDALKNHEWAPTPDDTPVPFGMVEAWQAKEIAGRRRPHA